MTTAPIIDLDRPATKYISPANTVWSRYAIELGDNGKPADACMTLMIAPADDASEDEFVYIETNGDPVLVGWLDGGEVRLADNAHEWIDDEAMAWVRPLLEEHFPD